MNKFTWKILEITTDKAQLQDADGNLMTPQNAKDFVGSLP